MIMEDKLKKSMKNKIVSAINQNKEM